MADAPTRPDDAAENSNANQPGGANDSTPRPQRDASIDYWLKEVFGSAAELFRRNIGNPNPDIVDVARKARIPRWQETVEVYRELGQFLRHLDAVDDRLAEQVRLRTKVVRGTASSPDYIEHDGTLDMTNKAVKYLPNNFHVTGSLRLTGTKLEELPAGLDVGGTLYIASTKITRIPIDLKVGDQLYAPQTEIQTLPPTITVGGSVDLSFSKLKRLPPGFCCEGSLRVNGSEIRGLPFNLRVTSDLDISNTKITWIEPDIDVGGRIIASGCEPLVRAAVLYRRAKELKQRWTN